MEFRWISLLPGVEMAISTQHRFTTDSVLLSRFAAPRPGERAVELGAGCGAVTLLWFGEGELTPATAACVELDFEATALLTMSVEKNGLTNRVFPIQADLRKLKSDSPLQAGRFDLVVCNPPYFPPGSQKEPIAPVRRAARQEVTATIDAVSAAAACLLRFGGRFCCCWRPERLPDLFEALRGNGLEPKVIRAVAPREGAAPSLFLVEAVRGGKKELRWLAPLLLYDKNGQPSEEYCSIYRIKGG